MAIDTTCIYVHTLCHWTLHFNEHCIFGVSSTHKKSTKICIQQIVMQPNMFYIMKSWVPYTQNRKSPPTGKSSQIPGGSVWVELNDPPPLPLLCHVLVLLQCFVHVTMLKSLNALLSMPSYLGKISYFTLILTSRVFHSL